jgi:NAD+ synthase
MSGTRQLRSSSRNSDTSQEIDRICGFIRKYVDQSKAQGVVLGLSGGIDSAVVACLAVKALGPQKILGVLLFESDAVRSSDYKDAISLVRQLGVKTLDINVSDPIAVLERCLIKANRNLSRLTLANLKARTRMTLLYGVANQRNLLVIGTGDRSEIQLGYFTKYGDGGVDLLPIGNLYKTEVRELAARLGVPSRIVNKPSSPRLWRNQKASDELPADYPILDRILTLLLDSSRSVESAARSLNVPVSLVRDVKARHQGSAHKRAMPPTPVRRKSL